VCVDLGGRRIIKKLDEAVSLSVYVSLVCLCLFVSLFYYSEVYFLGSLYLCFYNFISLVYI